MHGQELSLSSGFSCSHYEGREDSTVTSVKSLNFLEPVDPLVVNRVVEVIVNTSTFREFKLVTSSSEIAVEFTLAFIEAATETPDHGESIETIVHVLNTGHGISILLSIGALLIKEGFVSLVDM
jgi:hypothetical protein